ncbi:putative endo-beta-1,4-glucanase B [Ceratocystis fimbriata CBS 114723]|uniref:cellulase n=2 Tax=Ceratocystis TaxID=5157 RepID=A0A0F8B0T2_CERFI|nr:Endoglucanase 3 [Ceratocystis platani]PHH54693.1 putative endo-beta-1,4-glucanase B [Ceratocystis fimbriata CBS 114723]
MKTSTLVASALVGVVSAQNTAYSQCGGKNWTGAKDCISGYTCTVMNDYYSQCITSSGSGSGSGPDVKPASAKASVASVVAAATGVASTDNSCAVETDEPAVASTKPKAASTGGYAPAIKNNVPTAKSSTTPTGFFTSVTSTTTTTASTGYGINGVSSEPLASTPAAYSASATGTSSSSTPTSTPSTGYTSSGKGLKMMGASVSGAEFGAGSLPGVYGKDFTFANTSAIDALLSQGYNTIRLPFLMERLSPSLSGPLDSAYLKNYTEAVDFVTGKGGYAVLDPHNYGRYNGAVVTDYTAFEAFWKNVATVFKSNDKVIFDTNNEYHDTTADNVLKLNQAAIDGIRSAGATTQYIFVEGNSYTGAWTWNTTNTNLAALTDPSDKIIYEMHQYLDSDGSGTSETCVSSEIGAQRVAGATEWLKANKKIGIIGEFAGGTNSQCLEAVTGLLDHLKENSDVWSGALWWGAGPWWGDYLFSFEPPSGKGYLYYNSLLLNYLA